MFETNLFGSKSFSQRYLTLDEKFAWFLVQADFYHILIKVLYVTSVIKYCVHPGWNMESLTLINYCFYLIMGIGLTAAVWLADYKEY